MAQKCKYHGCETRASFGLRDSPFGPEFCAQHAHPEMVNLKVPLCKQGSCQHAATHCTIINGIKTCKHYCKDHAPPGYFNAWRDPCSVPNCCRPAVSHRLTYCDSHLSQLRAFQQIAPHKSKRRYAARNAALMNAAFPPPRPISPVAEIDESMLCAVEDGSCFAEIPIIDLARDDYAHKPLIF